MVQNDVEYQVDCKNKQTKKKPPTTPTGSVYVPEIPHILPQITLNVKIMSPENGR